MALFHRAPPRALGLTLPCVSDAAAAASLTCRRSASPRATGLGTGTEVAAGAHPSPVPPWSSSFRDPETWLLTANRRGAGHRHLHLPPASPPPNTHTPTWLLFRALYSEERLTTRTLVHLMASPPPRSLGQMGKRKKKKEKAQLLLSSPPCVNADLLCPRAAATGRLHPSACAEAPLHSDSQRATGWLCRQQHHHQRQQQHPPSSSYA